MPKNFKGLQMYRQSIDGGASFMTVNVNALNADADTALTSLMCGIVTEYKLALGDGGTALTSTPKTFNKKVLIVGKDKGLQGRLSTMVTLPHIKASRAFNDYSADIIGKFFASSNSAEKADYVKLKFDR